jgi:polyphosphate kinase
MTQEQTQSEPAALKAPELYINRELSWLEFNDRVLRQAADASVPLMERLKFLAITGSNLDEFFMIRVAGLKQQVAAGLAARDVSGMTPDQQLDAIAERAHRMVAEECDLIKQVTALLAEHGLHLLEFQQITPEQREFLASHFIAELLPVLTPLGADQLDPFPVLPRLQLNLALLLGAPEGEDEEPRVAVVPVPGNLPRFLSVPAEEGMHLVRLEQVIAQSVRHLFPQDRIEAVSVFRVTRDADVPIDDDAAGDLLQVVEDAVRQRRRRAVVRLEVSAGPDPRLLEWLMERCEAEERDVYQVDGMLDASALMEVVGRRGFDELRAPPWPPQPCRDLAGSEDLWERIGAGDALLCHPYESFEPVVRLVQLAAEDPNVLAIKQTFYRTSGDSPVVAALAAAAESGKQVTVLVELKARFDEARNVNWARRLEDAGCHVVYGVAGLKTHAKVLLIVRREAHGIRRYVHLSTGNYNDRTAKLYSDVGLMTSDRDMAADASALFNLMTGYSQEVGWLKFVISPTGLRQRIVELVEREVDASTLDQPGLIAAKLNSLQDPGICRALYRASRAGVKVLLNVRGICCLCPGVPDVSENIQVVSIVDRFLEHARIFYFRNGGHEEVYLASADWMTRNLDRRLEVMFPVLEPPLHARLVQMLETYFADNVKAWQLTPDGTYVPVEQEGPAVRAQEVLYRQAVAAQTQEPVRFRPLSSPDEGRGRTGGSR